MLPPLDYSTIVYDPPIGSLKKYFFAPPKITMTPEEIKEYRKNLRILFFHENFFSFSVDFCFYYYVFESEHLFLLEIRVSFEIENMVPPQPCKTFEDFNFDSLLNQTIAAAEYKVSNPHSLLL